MLSIKYYIQHPNELLVSCVQKCNRLFPDKLYLQLLFRLKMGYWPNLKNPKTFNEKLQWLKLYNRDHEYTTMVDKYAVKDYVANIIGREYIVPTLGVWDKPEDINWDSLPNQFVLKTTHGGGSTGVVVCKNKEAFDKSEAIEKLNQSLCQDDIYHRLREWPYKNVNKRVIAEKYITPENSVSDLTDYKWYCFNGEPMFCQVIRDRHKEETIDFFDLAWNHQEFVGLNPQVKNAKIEPTCPQNLQKQITLARLLSKNIPFVRVDLYEEDGVVYFGELTFYPMSGMGCFRPKKYDFLLGDLINLNF